LTKTKWTAALFPLVTSLIPNHVLAAPITWTTASVTSFWQENGATLTDYDSRIGSLYVLGVNSSTGIMTGSVSKDGATISYTGAPVVRRP
jgi:hypothetical protein